MSPVRAPVCLTRLVTLVAVTTLTLTGCSGGGSPGVDEASPPAPPAPPVTAVEPGACFGGATLASDDALALIGELDTLAVAAVRDLPTYDDPIACDQPHRLEIYAVVDAPEVARDYEAVLDSDAAAHQRIRSAVAAACREEADPALTAAADASPLDLIPSPAFAGGIKTSFLPFPHADWRAGDQKFACVLRQDSAGTARYLDFQSPELDPTLRVCLDVDLLTVACDTPHTREQLLVLTATPAVKAEQLPGREAIEEDAGGTYVDLRDEAFELLDVECRAYFALVANEPQSGLTAVAELYPELWGDSEGEFSVVCTVSSSLEVGRDDMVETSRSVVD